jgi:hypothetical protein
MYIKSPLFVHIIIKKRKLACKSALAVRDKKGAYNRKKGKNSHIICERQKTIRILIATDKAIEEDKN